MMRPVMRLSIALDVATAPAWALAWALAACGHAPPPKPVPAEQPVHGIADVAGNWVASDDMDWSYALALDPSGTLDLVIDRNKMGKCEEKGKLVPGSEPQKFQITYERNECNRDYNGAALQLDVASFTGDSLTIVISGYGSQEKHVFTRRPTESVVQ
jgi:hypothetical protein